LAVAVTRAESLVQGWFGPPKSGFSVILVLEVFAGRNLDRLRPKAVRSNFVAAVFAQTENRT
jgi:hypothetical protein